MGDRLPPIRLSVQKYILKHQLGQAFREKQLSAGGVWKCWFLLISLINCWELTLYSSSLLLSVLGYKSIASLLFNDAFSGGRTDQGRIPVPDCWTPTHPFPNSVALPSSSTPPLLTGVHSSALSRQPSPAQAVQPPCSPPLRLLPSPLTYRCVRITSRLPYPAAWLWACHVFRLPLWIPSPPFVIQLSDLGG